MHKKRRAIRLLDRPFIRATDTERQANLFRKLDDRPLHVGKALIVTKQDAPWPQQLPQSR